MAYRLSDLITAASAIASDIFHLRTTGGIDKKITFDNLKTSLLSNLIKGYMTVALTNYTSTGLPAIVANSQVEINGSVYTNPSEVAITGTTIDTTWYDILLTPLGSTFVASFIARGTGIWSDSKQGLYSGNNRVVACAYRIGSTNWINKNILKIINRNVIIEIDIGDWDMDTVIGKNMASGIDQDKVRDVAVMILQDGNTNVFPLDTTDSGASQGWIWTITDNNIVIQRLTNGIFDSALYNETSFNRGWIIVTYEV